MFYLTKNSLSTESFWRLFQSQKTNEASDTDPVLTLEVRYRIIETLEHEGLPGDAPLIRKVRAASDVAGLWFLRADIMHDLSLRYGELEAQTIMGDITPLFAGLVPDSLFRPAHIPFSQSSPAYKV